MWLLCSIASTTTVFGLLKTIHQKAVLSSGFRAEGALTIGSVVDGKVFRQIIDLPEFDAEGDYVISLRYADYRKRQRGRLWIKLIQGEVKQASCFDLSKLRDMQEVDVMLDPILIDSGEVLLEVTAQSMTSGVPTFWAHPGVSGHELFLNGTATGMELDVQFYRYGSCYDFLCEIFKGAVPVWVFFACIGLVFGALITGFVRWSFTAKSEDKKDCSWTIG